MLTDADAIERVLFATYVARTPAKIRDVLLDPAASESKLDGIETLATTEIRVQAQRLAEDGIGVVAVDDLRFPARLVRRGKAIVPALFYRGDLSILDAPLLAVSGSRDVTDRGAAAATRLGEIVAQSGLGLISGNARGVDALASTAALRQGGRSVLVLPEGIANSRVHTATQDICASSESLVLSQFSPNQAWTVHGAMGRNRVICALAQTVVVVEAGTSGGSLAAGRDALNLKRRLLVFTYGENTPPGNQILLDEGAIEVPSPEAFRDLLRTESGIESEQPRLL